MSQQYTVALALNHFCQRQKAPMEIQLKLQQRKIKGWLLDHLSKPEHTAFLQALLISLKEQTPLQILLQEPTCTEDILQAKCFSDSQLASLSTQQQLKVIRFWQTVVWGTTPSAADTNWPQDISAPLVKTAGDNSDKNELPAPKNKAKKKSNFKVGFFIAIIIFASKRTYQYFNEKPQTDIDSSVTSLQSTETQSKTSKSPVSLIETKPSSMPTPAPIAKKICVEGEGYIQGDWEGPIESYPLAFTVCHEENKTAAQGTFTIFWPSKPITASVSGSWGVNQFTLQEPQRIGNGVFKGRAISSSAQKIKWEGSYVYYRLGKYGNQTVTWTAHTQVSNPDVASQRIAAKNQRRPQTQQKYLTGWTVQLASRHYESEALAIQSMIPGSEVRSHAPNGKQLYAVIHGGFNSAEEARKHRDYLRQKYADVGLSDDVQAAFITSLSKFNH